MLTLYKEVPIISINLIEAHYHHSPIMRKLRAVASLSKKCKDKGKGKGEPKDKGKEKDKGGQKGKDKGGQKGKDRGRE